MRALPLLWALSAAAGCQHPKPPGAARDAGTAERFCPPQGIRARDEVPSGKCSGEGLRCELIAQGDPCPNPEDLPPLFRWTCDCRNGTWICQHTGYGHHVCGPSQK